MEPVGQEGLVVKLIFFSAQVERVDSNRRNCAQVLPERVGDHIETRVLF